jgi:hypothetical protein
MISMFLLTIEPVDAADYGKNWLNIPKWAQAWYIWGFVDGYIRGSFYGNMWDAYYFECEHRPEFKRFPKIKRPDCDTHKRLLPEDLYPTGLDYEAIADVMTRLYKNPANRLIDYGPIYEIAIKKLRGAPQKDIDEMLEIFRSTATGTNRKP